MRIHARSRIHKAPVSPVFAVLHLHADEIAIATSLLENRCWLSLLISCETTLYKLVRWEGIEPPTAWFVARYSIQLSYQRKERVLS